MRERDARSENISGGKMIFNCASIANRTPITADIFLNDYCNNKCPYCTYARYGDRNGEYMRFEDFKKYVDILRAAGVRGFILTGGGEPTISRDFDKIVAWLEANGIDYGINTNFNVFKAIKPKYLKVSLDAHDGESYKAKRGVDCYSKTIENIKKYVEWKKENSPSTSVGIQLVVESVEEAQRFYEAHKGLDIDYMNFRPFESTQGAYYDTHDETDIVAWLEEMNAKDRRVCINYKWYHLREKFERCYAQFAQIALNQRGEVMYCCHKPYEITGHITDPDIFEKIRKARTDMTMCDVPCRLAAPNKFIREIDAGCKDSAFI